MKKAFRIITKKGYILATDVAGLSIMTHTKFILGVASLAKNLRKRKRLNVFKGLQLSYAIYAGGSMEANPSRFTSSLARRCGRLSKTENRRTFASHALNLLKLWQKCSTSQLTSRTFKRFRSTMKMHLLTIMII